MTDQKPAYKSGLSWSFAMETKAIEDMTREELIAVVIEISNTLRGYQNPVHSRAYGLGMVEMIKRGENARPEGGDVG